MCDDKPCPKNIRIALNELKSCCKLPKEILTLRPQEVYKSEEKLFNLLAFLKYAFYCRDHSTRKDNHKRSLTPAKGGEQNKKKVSMRSNSELGGYKEVKVSENTAFKENFKKVDIRVKLKLLVWLEKLSIINQGSIEDITEYFRDGTLIYNLILSLEGVYLLINPIETITDKRNQYKT